jgi:programmed cell death 6-interacting protein
VNGRVLILSVADIYNERRKDIIENKIGEVAGQLKGYSDRTLQSLNLPASLEALERPIGLPPSLLRKAEEVRLENGPQKVDQSLGDVQRLAENAVQILNEVLPVSSQFLHLHSEHSNLVILALPYRPWTS